jgi:hypothetical protein
MFENDISVTVRGVTVTVTIVVVVKNVVITLPCASLVVPLCPYSKEVVYLSGVIVVGAVRELVGITIIQGGEHVRVDVSQISVPT